MRDLEGRSAPDAYGVTTKEALMLGYNPDNDPHRHNPEVHYRLYYHSPEKKVVVVCVQDFDYRDYDTDGWVGYEAFETQQQAELALLALKALFANS